MVWCFLRVGESAHERTTHCSELSDEQPFLVQANRDAEQPHDEGEEPQPREQLVDFAQSAERERLVRSWLEAAASAGGAHCNQLVDDKPELMLDQHPLRTADTVYQCVLCAATGYLATFPTCPVVNL